MILPDVSVWLALAFEAHGHHRVASHWFENDLDGECYFCRVTQQGFLRIATNPKAFGVETLTMVQAWDSYDALLQDSRISLIPEPAGLESRWRHYTSDQTFSPKVWTDAYLAAFAESVSMQLVTLDKAFVRYELLDSLILG